MSIVVATFLDAETWMIVAFFAAVGVACWTTSNAARIWGNSPPEIKLRT